MENFKHMNNPIDFMGTTRTRKIQTDGRRTLGRARGVTQHPSTMKPSRFTPAEDL